MKPGTDLFSGGTDLFPAKDRNGFVNLSLAAENRSVPGFEPGFELLERIPRLAARWRSGEIDAPVFAGSYFLIWQIAVHGCRFAARRDRDDRRPDAAVCATVIETAPAAELRACLIDWFERYQFRGIIAGVPVALVQWLRGAWPLVLREDIPPPLEVLRMQASGTRAVTALTAYPRLRAPVLHKADAYSFFVHDLEHAYKFFFSPELHAGQRAFFARLEASFGHGVFAPYLDDTGFVGRLHYLMSDMNTHPEHSRQYLRAVLVEAHLRREGRSPAESLSPAAEQAIERVMQAIAGDGMSSIPPAGILNEHQAVEK
jgi:hypothetical protein